MSNQKKTHDLIRQNEQIAKKSQKHEANLQKNSTLYFQVGLIVCLLATFGLLEMKFETTIPSINPPIEIGEPMYVDIPRIKTKVPEILEPAKKRKLNRLKVILRSITKHQRTLLKRFLKNQKLKLPLLAQLIFPL